MGDDSSEEIYTQEAKFSRFDELMLFKSFISYLLDVVLTIHTIYTIYNPRPVGGHPTTTTNLPDGDLKYTSTPFSNLPDGDLNYTSFSFPYSTDGGFNCASNSSSNGTSVPNSVPKELYLACFLVPSLLAGIKSLHWYYLRYMGDLDDHEKENEERRCTWIVRFLFFMLSPIPRFLEVWKLGRTERRLVFEGCSKKTAKKAYKKYVEAGTNLYFIRFFEIFLQDSPVLIFKIHDAVFGNIALWKEFIKCGLGLKWLYGNFPFHVFKLFFKLYKMSDVMLSYTVRTKKWWHMDRPSQFKNVFDAPARDGTINPFGKAGVFFYHFFQITAKCWCYAMLIACNNPVLQYAVVICRWLLNSSAYMFERRLKGFINEETLSFIGRWLSVLSFGGIRLFTYINLSQGRQLGRIIVFQVMNALEMIAVWQIWRNSFTLYDQQGLIQKDDFFKNIASWILLFLLVASVFFQGFYYAILHRTASPSLDGLCCRDPEETVTETMPMENTSREENTVIISPS